MTWALGYVVANLLAVLLGAPLLLGIRWQRITLLYTIAAVFGGALLVGFLIVRDALERRRRARGRADARGARA